MLFVALLKAKFGTNEERTTRRLEWDYPEDGAEPVAEYWLQSPDPTVVAVFNADHIGQIWATFQGWDDVFDLTVIPAVEAAVGLEMLKQMNPD